jgi:S1-C subfamily serine protease
MATFALQGGTRRSSHLFFPLTAFVVLVGFITTVAAADPDAEASVVAAICPIVYRLDESPSSRGYHYTFYGNTFFINEQGYLLTAAHVVEAFRNGGQPSILVTRPNSPPQLLPITVVAADPQHDVAILRASPNPFVAHYRVAFLKLASDPATPGQSVLALSLHPLRLQNAQSFQSPVEDRSTGQVVSYESTQLEKSGPPAEVFLLSHPVVKGQSGSPVLASDSLAVIGLVEGRWLRGSVLPLAHADNQSDSHLGAAVPIRYAISLLQQNGISWHVISPASVDRTSSTQP